MTKVGFYPTNTKDMETMAKEKMSITLDKQVKERLEQEADKEELPTSTVLNRILKKVFGIKSERQGSK